LLTAKAWRLALRAISSIRCSQIATSEADASIGMSRSIDICSDSPMSRGGAKAYFEHAGPVGGVMIGYPGLDHVVTGGRGVLRARVHVHGVAGHSGSARAGAGAIARRQT